MPAAVYYLSRKSPAASSVSSWGIDNMAIQTHPFPIPTSLSPSYTSYATFHLPFVLYIYIHSFRLFPWRMSCPLYSYSYPYPSPFFQKTNNAFLFRNDYNGLKSPKSRNAKGKPVSSLICIALMKLEIPATLHLGSLSFSTPFAFPPSSTEDFWCWQHLCGDIESIVSGHLDGLMRYADPIYQSC